MQSNEAQGKRLNKFIADSGYCSRREADRLIQEGRVTIDGRVGALGDRVLPGMHVVCDGHELSGRGGRVYIMLNKPRGIVCTADPREPMNVVDYVGYPIRIFPVGRLDKDSEGLLLMTDDGAFINLLTHPSGGVGKLYRVTVHPRATEEQVIQMSSGVVLDDGVRTQPCVIHVVTDEPERTVMEITLYEGRNRQIRRMCAAVGLEVVRLKRSAEGPVKLGMLQPGEWRELKRSEVNALRNAAQQKKKQKV